MKRVLSLAVFFLLAGVAWAFAAEATTSAAVGNGFLGLVVLGACLGVGVAASGCGVGWGTASVVLVKVSLVTQSFLVSLP